MSINVTENEARHYWRLVSMLRSYQQGVAISEEFADLVDELDVLREATDTPRLKARCSELLAVLAPERVAV